jgi:PhzF family phenazine biosynthesis protein
MKLFWVNSFTTEAFSGNPAGVCISDTPLDEKQMQSIATELNLSETAFTHQLPNGHWQLRWFTPTTEVPLCGHATLATAHILWTEQLAHIEFPIVFKTLSVSNLNISLSGHGITLAFPKKPLVESSKNKNEIESILGKPIQKLFQTLDKERWVAVLNHPSDVELATPDLKKLKQLEGMGLVITAKADSTKNYEIVSRYFAPQIGIDEDPVTGVAHCCVGPYWLELLNLKSLTAYQASKRGGLMVISMQNENTVLLTGQAITLFGGKASLLSV